MKFIFTGTGTSQGIPVIGCTCEVCTSTDPRDNRLRTSGVLSSGTTTIVFDTGPDFRQQMLRHKIDILDAVVFTHQHKDHMAGMDDIRSYNFRLHRPMEIFGNAGTLAQLKHEFSYIFDPKDYPGVPRVSLNEIDKTPFSIGDLTLTPIPVMHRDLPVLGYRVGNFAYITDANYIPDSSMKLLNGLEVLVLNALRKRPHYSHFTLEQAIEVVQKLKPKKAFFTHLSHDMGKHADVSKELPADIEFAYDGLTVEITDSILADRLSG